jgi:hypothetical protein
MKQTKTSDDDAHSLWVHSHGKCIALCPRNGARCLKFGSAYSLSTGVPKISKVAKKPIDSAVKEPTPYDSSAT